MTEESDQGSKGHLTYEGSAESPGGKSLQIGNVLKIVVPAFVILAGAFVFFGLFDGAQRLANLMKPSRVSVTGRVLFNDEPLPNAEIATQPVKPGLRGAIGTTDEQGRFKLMTHIDGEFLEGAYQGEHRVTVIRRHNVSTLGPPPLMTPEQYASFDSSPLRIEVSQEHSVVLRLQGELSPAPPSPPPMVQRPPGGAGAAAANSPQPDEDGIKETGRK